MAPPFRADQVGSLLRPKELLEARASLASPSRMYDASQDDNITKAEQEAIAWAAKKQLDLGIRPICSGEYTRHIFYGGFFETLGGMKAEPELPIPQAFRTDYPTTTGLAEMGAKTRAAVVCTGPIEWKSSAYMREWELLRQSLPKELWSEAKITLPSPSYQHIQLAPGTAYTAASGYKSDQEYFQALGAALNSEIHALYDAGVRNIQVDDPNMTYFCSSQFLTGCRKDGTDPAALLDTYLKAHNYYLRSKPADLHMGVHLCRGNMSGSKHWVSGSYEEIAEALFTKTDFQTYYLEFDDEERQGGFEPLRFLPKGKNVVLGLVSTKKADREVPGEVVAKVRRAAEVVAKAQGLGMEEALDCLAVSPQCGFSSSSLAGGREMTMERMWEKLGLVREVAGEVWK